MTKAINATILEHPRIQRRWTRANQSNSADDWRSLIFFLEGVEYAIVAMEGADVTDESINICLLVSVAMQRLTFLNHGTG